MYNADSLPSTINIGFTGEKNFRSVEIDMNEWLEQMPGGTPAIVYIRPLETEAYRPYTTLNDGIMKWTVTDEDLGINEGLGRMQLEIKTESKTRKGKIVNVQVHLGIMR